MKLSVSIEEWKLAQPFRIANREWTCFRSLVVQLRENSFVGRGVGNGVFYLGEDADSIYEQVQDIEREICAGITREELQTLLPPGGARNAVDCALWDLECKKSGKSIWALTGIEPKPVTTVFTIGLESTPEAMAEKAARACNAPILKIKLDDHLPYEKLSAIRKARPDAVLVVDANQSWDFDLLQELIPKCQGLNLGMIEQPLARGADEQLNGFQSPITLAADESCLHTGELQVAAGRYDMINIKLDKAGGLTESLKLAAAAKAAGKKLMIGSMGGSSLAMAPAVVMAQLCEFVDVDGPLLQRYDCPNSLIYKHGVVDVFKPSLWG